MSRSAAIAAVYMLALTQGGTMLSGSRAIGPREYMKPAEESHDAERIAKAEAKRARKAAKRAKREGVGTKLYALPGAKGE